MTTLSIRSKHLLIFPSCALFFFVGATIVQAATYYVAAGGNDAQTCVTAQSITTPKRSIASAVACLNPGDTLYLRGGTWTEQIDMSAKTGTPGNYITVAAYPGETVTIASSTYPFAIKGTYSANNAYLIFDGLILDGVNAANLLYWTIGGGSHDIIARNLEIKNWKGSGMQIGGTNGGGDNISVINCKIHDQRSLSGLPGERWYGIYFANGANGLIEGNEIYNNPGGGIQAYPGTIKNLAIRRNSIHHNNSLDSASVGGLIIGVENASISGVEVANNLFYSNGTSAAHYAPGIEVTWGVAGTKIWNNTVYGNRGYGIQVSISSAINTVIQNNIVYGNMYDGIYNVGSNTILDHNRTTDPSFVNAASFDFNLQPSSPAIDAGATLSQIKTDLKNNPRPQGKAYDIGAYEAGGNLDTTPPSPPQNVSVR